jgi:chemotaxis-related protein WspB
MLFLVFQLGKDRYAIEARQIIEVLHLVNLKLIPQAPAGVAGIFDYHGTSVPLIDLAELATGKSSRRWMSTRIILVKYEGPSGETHMLGLLAEQVTETLRRNDEDFSDAGLAVTDTPYLGNVTTDAGGIVQRIEIPHLLSASVRDLLFAERIGAV